MVAARRCFDGVLPLSSLSRLRGSLVDTEGEVRYSLEFGQDDVLKVPYVELNVDAGLPLECQRSLARFLLPVKVTQRLGLVRSEDEEAALPQDYEALLVPEDGMLKPADLIEDELVLAVPVVPMAPGTESVESEWTATREELDKVNPFAELARLKKQ